MRSKRNVSLKKATSTKLKNYKNTYRSNTVIIGEIERFVTSKFLEEEYRNPHVIHVSEVCKPDECRRKIYYRLVDTPPDAADVNGVGFQLRRIYDEGSAIHDKYQQWLWSMGRLYGYFECLVCDAYWYGHSPKECTKCGAPRKKLKYREVPVESEEHMLSGHADAQVDEGLIEIKSVGVGTLRFEAPGFHDKLQSGEWTLQQTWDAIKRPFPVHVRQVMVYAYCKGIKKVIVIYECKWNQAIKEFVVSYSDELVAPVLEVCKDIKWAVEKKRPVDRPEWADKEAKACKSCPYWSTCYATEVQNETKRKPKFRVKDGI